MNCFGKVAVLAVDYKRHQTTVGQVVEAGPFELEVSRIMTSDFPAKLSALMIGNPVGIPIVVSSSARKVSEGLATKISSIMFGANWTTGVSEITPAKVIADLADVLWDEFPEALSRLAAASGAAVAINDKVPQALINGGIDMQVLDRLGKYRLDVALHSLGRFMRTSCS